MYSLIFDTTALNCSIALLKKDKIIGNFAKEMDFGHAEVLIPEIKTLLEKSKVAFEKLSLIAVCIGPGSFTGVRTSVATARAFQIAYPDMKILGISAFEAYMETLDVCDLSPVTAVIIETKRDDFYYQLFDFEKNKLSEATAGTKEEIIAKLKNYKKISFVGDGVERFLFQPTGLPIHCIKSFTGIPIEALAICGLNKYKNKAPSNLHPLYLRSADVGVKQSCSI